MEKGSFPEGVQAPAIQLLPVILYVLVGIADGLVRIAPVTLRLVGLHAFAPDLPVQQAADRERAVAHELGIQAPARLAGKPPVVHARFRHGGPELGGLPVGFAFHDQPRQVLHVPAALHELDRQPVEQVRMAGPGTLVAQVVEYLREAAAKIQVPQPVDEDPGGQRIVRLDQPLRQVHAICPPRLFNRAQEGGDGGLHLRPRIVHPVAAREHPHRARRLALAGDHGVAPLFPGFIQPALGLFQGFLFLLALGLGGFLLHLFRLAPLFVLGVLFLESGDVLLRFLDGGIHVLDHLDGGLENGCASSAGHQVRLLQVREKCGHPVEIRHRIGVELVIVALRAGHGRAQPHRGNTPGLVRHVLRPVFLGLGTAFPGDLVHAGVAGGHELLCRGLLDQVPGQLLAGKAIEGHVAVEGIDDVVPVRGGVAFVVGMEAHGVRPADEVEPVDRHALPVVRRCQELFNQGRVAPWIIRGLKSLYQPGIRGQAGEVETQASHQGHRVGRGSGLQALLVQPGPHEGIDGVGCTGDLRYRRPGCRDIGPVPLIRCTFRDPLPEQGLLLLGKGLGGIRRRHQLLRVVLENAVHQRTLSRSSRDDRLHALAICHG